MNDSVHTSHRSHLAPCIHTCVHSIVPIDKPARASPRTCHGDSLIAQDGRGPTPGSRTVAGAVRAQDGDSMQNRSNPPLELLRRQRPFSAPESARDESSLPGYLRGEFSAMREPPGRSGRRCEHAVNDSVHTSLRSHLALCIHTCVNRVVEWASGAC